MSAHTHKSQNPEKFSGHKLVNWLIENPKATGNFKFHTLLSCMWRELLIACPQFASEADYQKINLRDAVKIINAVPQLAFRFDWKNIRPADWVDILVRHPELASGETTSHLKGYFWSELLKKRPDLAPMCPFEKLDVYDWCNLMSSSDLFADRCPWHTFDNYHWERLVQKRKACLKFYTLEHFENKYAFAQILSVCYLGLLNTYWRNIPFEEEPLDPATFLIRSRIDRETAKRKLKEKYLAGDWNFIEELCDISPEDALNVRGKKYLPFFLTLAAPDAVFFKLYKYFDRDALDSAGNTLLLPALIHGVCQPEESMQRYDFLLDEGFDPKRKNLAGFSCSELLQLIKQDLSDFDY